ncbi:uncharacterized protein PHACADRAFT_186382 [Phanerochaete carnosa HHB-10118-sp]|uniref:Myb/SANT-like domain-containing protein n=1 Tax=Phanerochaete carnosa (strain HHB-10118-sp) TaxID=650164 RepID=K5W3Z8_PHACS|nr:uncharacterized protein PHACADRAFT_186382 [Phanerochaete carnosa HHB-10118-sp]EKM53830.1 hypothetical protein PHACADRAFT_186382 [Phanerochaete carnosa HHB-10118-sp]
MYMSTSKLHNTLRTPSMTVPGCNRAIWTPEDDKILMDVLLEARSRGEAYGSPRCIVWRRAAIKVNAESTGKYGAAKTAMRCFGHFRALKDRFLDFCRLRNQPGIGWDDEKKMLIIPGDKWEEIVMANGRYKKYRSKPWPLFEKMKVLCDMNRPEDVADRQPLPAAPQTEAARESPASPALEYDEEDDFWLEGDDSYSAQAPSASASGPALSQHTVGNQRKRSSSPDRTSRKRPRGPRNSTTTSSDFPPVSPTMTRSISENAHMGSARAQRAASPAGGEHIHGRSSPSAAERRAKAIHLMEDDNEYSDSEQVAIIELFERSPAVVDSFLAISKKHTRILYVRHALSNHARDSSPRAHANSCTIM